MTTRASTARGQDKQHFQGRVRKWRRQWDLANDTAKYKLLKWVPTDERTEDRSLPRFPNLQPVPSKISGTSQPESVVEHQPPSSGHDIANPMVAPSSSAHPSRNMAQPLTSFMLDAPEQPVAQLPPMDVISTTPS